jgi:cytochrome c oxidase subunit 3
MGLMALGLATSFTASKLGTSILMLGVLVTFLSSITWWTTVSKEFIKAKTDPHALPHEHAASVLTPGMIFFIASEVMFFGAFFAFYFYSRYRLGGEYLPKLWSEGNLSALNPEDWWGMRPALQVEIEKKLPAINTVILITSGFTYTWAHHALNHGKRLQTKIGLLITILLGLTFLMGQKVEWAESGMTLGSGLLGSAFFMLTGFHGAHVIVGVIWLCVMFLRIQLGHFDAKHQFAFRACGWYWHFVDVVWIALFSVLYLWS